MLTKFWVSNDWFSVSEVPFKVIVQIKDALVIRENGGVQWKVPTEGLIAILRTGNRWQTLLSFRMFATDSYRTLHKTHKKNVPTKKRHRLVQILHRLQCQPKKIWVVGRTCLSSSQSSAMTLLKKFRYCGSPKQII